MHRTALAALCTVAALTVLWPGTGRAQSHHPGHGRHAAATAPYAGQQTRAIKALSTEDVQGLLAGEGLGLAKAAGLNHYPGPRHVLDLGAELGLSAAQRAEAAALFDSMRRRAVALGTAILALERKLDAGFAAGQMQPEALGRLTGDIARLQGRLRATLLQAHLAVRHLLSPEQISTYDRLRGYANP